MTAMTDESALRAAAKANPLDPTPRLMLADHLDELDRPLDAALQRVLAEPDEDRHRLDYASVCERLGDVARAEFIRLQVEAHKYRVRGISPNHDDYPRLSAINQIEWQMARSRPEWMTEAISDPVSISIEDCHDLAPDHAVISFSRGFVGSVACAAADWIANANTITESQPIARVRLTTMPNYEWQMGNLGPGWVKARTTGTQYLAQIALEYRWPRIIFELPPRP